MSGVHIVTEIQETMPNHSYTIGRRFEYATRNKWRTNGYTVLRSAGSHGPFDLVAIRANRKVELIQCKIFPSFKEGQRALKEWVDNPPLPPSENYHQTLEYKIKGSAAHNSITV